MQIIKMWSQQLYKPLRIVYLRASCVMMPRELLAKNEYSALPISAKYLYTDETFDNKIQDS